MVEGVVPFPEWSPDYDWSSGYIRYTCCSATGSRGDRPVTRKVCGRLSVIKRWQLAPSLKSLLCASTPPPASHATLGGKIPYMQSLVITSLANGGGYQIFLASGGGSGSRIWQNSHGNVD